jgi:hypothetical protein
MTTPTALADHQAGHPYMLNREQFLQFLGQTQVFKEFYLLFEKRGDCLVDYRLEQRAFWACISALEAAREFNPLDGGCESSLTMDTHHGCTMAWAYKSTSQTLFEAIEPRECYSGERLPEAIFRVTIPADRDIPGRYHHDRLAAGESYCG